MMRLIPVNNSYSYHITRQSTFFPVPLSFWLASVIEACLYQQKQQLAKRKLHFVFSFGWRLSWSWRLRIQQKGFMN